MVQQAIKERDEQRHRRELREVALASTGERRIGEFVQQRARFPIDDAIPAGLPRVRSPRWLIPVSGGPRNSASSRCAIDGRCWVSTEAPISRPSHANPSQLRASASSPEAKTARGRQTPATSWSK
jgi:hypothetical protein